MNSSVARPLPTTGAAASPQDNGEDEESMEVRRLAERLAPALEQAEDFFRVPVEFQVSPQDNNGTATTDALGRLSLRSSSTTVPQTPGGPSLEDNDDDLEREMRDIEESHALLRQELEQANHLESLFFGASPPSPTPVQQQPAVVEADMDARDDESPESILLQQQQRGQQHVVVSPLVSPRTVASTTPSSPSRRRITTPLSAAAATTPGSVHSAATAWQSVVLVQAGHQPLSYTIQDHARVLEMQSEVDDAAANSPAWQTVHLTSHVASLSSSSGPISHAWGLKEYCCSMPVEWLKQRYVGLSPETKKRGSRPGGTQSSGGPLPVRTLAIQIRPDVLCGAVMDAARVGLCHSHDDDDAAETPDDNDAFGTTAASPTARRPTTETHVLKRQGGHLRAVVMTTTTTTTSDSTTTTTKSGFVVDVRLCTYKRSSHECERRLLIRIYHADGEGGKGDSSETTPRSTTASSFFASPFSQKDDASAAATPTTRWDEDDNDATQSAAASRHVREACALLQRMEVTLSPQPRHRRMMAQSPTLSDRDSLKEVVSKHLLSNYKACPSVKAGHVTLPALNSEDSHIIQASWPFVQAMWEELESRDLTYTTLTTMARFGTFPSLPTLDVHYCSQMRLFSRETMIVQLLKSASSLEEYARQSEYNCANTISLLQPAFETYGIQPPALPKPVPLTSYPLNYVAPQKACPPWGLKVMEALNEVQAWTGEVAAAALAAGEENNPFLAALQHQQDQETEAGPSPFAIPKDDAVKSVEMAERAVGLVLTAFQKQDDEEQGARLERKNVQVMDRLAKMQAHQRASIQAIQNAAADDNDNSEAANAADEFQVKAQGIREVPLLKWSIVVGSATGTCWVTANHILFVTQLIPVIGGSTTTVFPLQDVELVMRNAPASLLNPTATVVIGVQRVQDSEEVYSFRPSVGGARLKSFLDIVKAVATETPLE